MIISGKTIELQAFNSPFGSTTIVPKTYDNNHDIYIYIDMNVNIEIDIRMNMNMILSINVNMNINIKINKR